MAHIQDVDLYPSPCRASWKEGGKSIAEVGGPGRRWNAQRQRRSDILATTRRFLAQRGDRGVQLRSIAADCHISVQTIYNLVGDRDQVIEQALIDWVASLEIAARNIALAADLNMAVVMTGMFWASPILEPHYVASVARLTVSGDHQLNRAVRHAATKTMLAAVLAMSEQGGLLPDVDPKSLSRQLISLAHTAICDWTMERHDVSRYWSGLRNGPGMMIRGAVNSHEHERVARSLGWRPLEVSAAIEASAQ